MSSNCKANLNNIPRSTNRGKIELVLYKNFRQCSTSVSRLQSDELNGSDQVNDFKYKNTVYFNAAASGDVKTISANFPDISALIEPNDFNPPEERNHPVLVPLLEWECRYPHNYHIAPSNHFLQDGKDIELPNALTQLNGPCSTVDGRPASPNCFSYSNLRISNFAYSTPEFLNDDILNRYVFKLCNRLLIALYYSNEELICKKGINKY